MFTLDKYCPLSAAWSSGFRCHMADKKKIYALPYTLSLTTQVRREPLSCVARPCHQRPIPLLLAKTNRLMLAHCLPLRARARKVCVRASFRMGFNYLNASHLWPTIIARRKAAGNRYTYTKVRRKKKDLHKSGSFILALLLRVTFHWLSHEEVVISTRLYFGGWCTHTSFFSKYEKKMIKSQRMSLHSGGWKEEVLRLIIIPQRLPQSPLGRRGTP